MLDKNFDCLATGGDARQGQRVIEEVYSFLGRFVSYPSDYAQTAHALWIIHAHLMDKWDSTPRLAFLSAEPASGKTRALEITELLVPNAVCAVNVSPAYLFRKVGCGEGATILFDEIDTVFGPKARENEELRGLLNAGHRRGAVTGRCVVRGKEIITEEIPAYAGVALAGLGWLPDTILSRSVVIRMRRRRPDEFIEQFRRRMQAPHGHGIRSRIEVWAKSATIPWLSLPPEIQDRDADVWESLIAVADAIGGEWPVRARAAGVALVTASKDVEPSLGIRLLTDLRVVFENADELSSKSILHALNALEESPWGDLRGKPLDERGLANRLKQYGVKSRTIRIGGSTPKGYRRVDLFEAWGRYLPLSPDKSATTATNAVDRNFPTEDVAAVADVAELCTDAGTNDSAFDLENAVPGD